MPPMRPGDPAYWMLLDEYTTSTKVYDPHCYICNDPEFAQMGLPLCTECDNCKRNSDGKELGHIAADDTVCTVCGWDAQEAYFEEQERND